jgi:hypothetical protein
MNTHHWLVDIAAQNRLDHYLYQNSLFLVVLFVGAILGLGLGWIFWYRCKNQTLLLEKENAELLDQSSRKTS